MKMKIWLGGKLTSLAAGLDSIIDWDDVGTVPLKLSAVSIADSFVRPRSRYGLYPEVDELFRQELSRIELERSSSTEWSHMFLHSKENLFLFYVLRKGFNFITLRHDHPEFLEEALLRNSTTLALAAVEWKAVVEDHFLSKGLSIPRCPLYVQIQEGLGLYGRWEWERKVRKIKRQAQKRLALFVDHLRRW